MKTIEEQLEEVKKKMARQLDKGQNCEKTNFLYRDLIKEVLFKDSKYYENQFKPKV